MEFQVDWLFPTLVLSFFGIIYLYFTRSHNYWKKKGIIYEAPTFFCGNFKDAVFMKKSMGEVVTSLYDKYRNEKVVGVYAFNKPVLLVRDPELIYRVMVNDFYNFSSNEQFISEDVDPVFGKNLFILRGERWKKERQITRPAFTIAKIKAVYPQMLKIADSLAEYIEKHPEELLLKDLFGRYTSEIVVGTGLGIQGHAFTQQDPPFHSMGKILFLPDFWNGIKSFVFFTIPFLGRFLKIRFVPQKVTDFFAKIIKEVVVLRDSKNESRNDILQYFIDLKKKSIEVEKGTVKSDLITRRLSDDDIVVGMVTFFLDGYETTSAALVHMFYELAKNPDVQEKIRREIYDAEQNSDGQWSIEQLSTMPILTNAILETLRLYPPLQNFGKVCTKDTEINIGENKSFLVEKGTIMYVPVRGVHHDAEYWEDPEVFNPDRFTNDEKVARKRGTFLPFGEGPRICIGMTIAQVVMKVAMIKILRQFEIVRTERTPKEFQQDPNYFLSSHKGGIYARLQKLKE